MILTTVYKLLTDSPDIPSGVKTAIHYGERPVKYPLPALVLQASASSKTHTLKRAAGPEQGFFRVTALASTYLADQDLARTVVGVLEGTTGLITGVPVDEVATQDVKVGYIKNPELDLAPSDHRDGEGKIRTHGVDIDFAFHAQLAA